jgi:mRNA deadenylase 3'-5' endonuclease subunit Ccr4
MKKHFVKTYLVVLAIASSLTLNAGSFKIASWNILAEWAYDAFADKKKIELMPFKQRKQLLLDNLDKLNQKHIDIVCLQEVDMRKGSEGPEIQKHLEKLGYTVVAPKTLTSQATVVAYKKNFKGSNAYEITLTNASGGSKKQCATETVLFKNDPALPSVKIISLHLPYESEQDELDNIKNNVLKHANKQGFTIICGDFNYTTYSSNPQDTVLNYKNLVDAKHFFTQLWADAGLQHGFNATGTAYSQAFKHMDYMFYTTTYKNYSLACTKYEQAPQDLTRLIKHTKPNPGEGASYSDFPSDHALLIAEFELEDTSKKVADSSSITKLGKALASLSV